ncbi:hypothetical protein RUM43_015123, partial [Polyplax serrata]
VTFDDFGKFNTGDLRAVELEIDKKTGCLVDGQVDLKTGKLFAEKFDLISGKAHFPIDRKINKVVYGVYDPSSLRLLSGQFDGDSGKIVGKIDPKTFDLVDISYDPVEGRFFVPGVKRGIFDKISGVFLPKEHEIYVSDSDVGKDVSLSDKLKGKLSGALHRKDVDSDIINVGNIGFGDIPSFDLPNMKGVELEIDPRTGKLLDGQVDLTSGVIDCTKFDLCSGRLKFPHDKKYAKSVYAVIDPSNLKLLPGQFDESDGKLIGRIDPTSLRLVEIEYDPKSGSFIGKKVRDLFGRFTGSLGRKGFDFHVAPLNFDTEPPRFISPDLKSIELQIDTVSGKLLPDQVDLNSLKIFEPKFDLDSGKLKNPVDMSRGRMVHAAMLPKTMSLVPGQFDSESGKYTGYIDPVSFKLFEVDYDGKSGNFYKCRPKGTYDVDTGEIRTKGLEGDLPRFGFERRTFSIGDSPKIDRNDIKVVELQIDTRTGRLLEGLVDLNTGKICESKFDVENGKLRNPVDGKLGRTIQAYMNGKNNELLPGQFDLKTGKLIGEINPKTLKVSSVEFDPKTGKFLTGKFKSLKGRLSGSLKRSDVKGLWPDLGDINFDELPSLETNDFKAIELEIDSKTGRLFDGQVDLRCGKVNESAIELRTGKLRKPTDMKSGKLVYGIIDINKKTLLPGQFDEKDGKLIGKLDPKTFKLLEVDYDPKSGTFMAKNIKGFYDRLTGSLKIKDFDTDIPEVTYGKLPVIESNDVRALEFEIDPSTGCLLEDQVDLTTGKINESRVDTDTGVLKKSLGGKVIYAMIDVNKKELIPGQFDDLDGRVIGRMDPDTFELVEVNYDPSTESFLTGRLKGRFDKISGSFTPRAFEIESKTPDLSSLSFKVRPNIDKQDLRTFEFQVDPMSGRLLDGQADLSTGKIIESQFDLALGKLKTPRERKYGTSVSVLVNKKDYTLLPGQFDENTGKLIGEINPKTLKFNPIEFEPKVSKEWGSKMKDFAGRLTGSVKEKDLSDEVDIPEYDFIDTENMKTFEVQIEPKTGRLLDGQIDLKTGTLDITKYNPTTGKLLKPVDKKNGKTVFIVAEPKTLKIIPGQIDNAKAKIIGRIDPKTYKLFDVNFDSKSGKFTLGTLKKFGGKPSLRITDSTFGVQSSFADPSIIKIEPLEVKFDEFPPIETNDFKSVQLQIDPKTAKLIDDQVELATGHINKEKFDMTTGKLLNPVDESMGKIVYAIIDSKSLNLIPGQFDAETGNLVGKFDTKRREILGVHFDPKTGKFFAKTGVFDKIPINFRAGEQSGEKIEVVFDELPKSHRPDVKFVELQIDPLTGRLNRDQVNFETWKLRPEEFNLSTGKLIRPLDKNHGTTLHAAVDPDTLKLLPGQFSDRNGTLIGRIDPQTLKIIDVSYDPKSGSFRSGKIRGFLQKLGEVFSIKEHEIEVPESIKVDLTEKPLLKSETTMAIPIQIDTKTGTIIPGQIDSVTEKVLTTNLHRPAGKQNIPLHNKIAKTIYVIIDPKTDKLLPGQLDKTTLQITGKIDPKTNKLTEIQYDPNTQEYYKKRQKGFFGKIGEAISTEHEIVIPD